MTPASPPSRAPRTWRLLTVDDVRAVLIGLGILSMLVGCLVLINDIPPRQYPAILTWLVLVLVVHDVVIAGAVFALAIAGRRAEGRVPHGTILLFQAAVATGGLLALLVAPEIAKQAIGTANPSVLPLDYGLNLAILLIALLLAAVGASVLQAAISRRRR
ncbi:hypothetical protein GCM10009807_30350 [Microbacterium lacus]|uniref:Uncharacterized protein n=1 Tax=Microbacterium lacus TaxID=415217 RepID=A0ABN2HAX6_9MICO